MDPGATNMPTRRENHQRHDPRLQNNGVVPKSERGSIPFGTRPHRRIGRPRFYGVGQGCFVLSVVPGAAILYCSFPPNMDGIGPPLQRIMSTRSVFISRSPAVQIRALLRQWRSSRRCRSDTCRQRPRHVPVPDPPRRFGRRAISPARRVPRIARLDPTHKAQNPGRCVLIWSAGGLAWEDQVVEKADQHDILRPGLRGSGRAFRCWPRR